MGAQALRARSAEPHDEGVMRRRVRDTIQNRLADAPSWRVVGGIGAPIGAELAGRGRDWGADLAVLRPEPQVDKFPSVVVPAQHTMTDEYRRALTPVDVLDRSPTVTRWSNWPRPRGACALGADRSGAMNYHAAAISAIDVTSVVPWRSERPQLVGRRT